jgi:hypothetical protein
MKQVLSIIFCAIFLANCSSNDDNEIDFKLGGSFTVNVNGENYSRNCLPSSIETEKCNSNQRLKITDTAEIETSTFTFDIRLSSPVLASDFDNPDFNNVVINSSIYANCINDIWNLNPSYSEKGKYSTLDSSYNNSSKINSVNVYKENSTIVSYIVSGVFDVRYKDEQSNTTLVSGSFDIEVQALK